MNRRWKVVTLALITAAAFTLSVAAQDDGEKVDVPAPESNTSKATFGNFGTDVDDYFDVHSYGDVKFDKYFGYAGVVVDTSNTGALALHLGYAKKFRGLYLGTFYAGRIVDKGGETTTTTTTTVGEVGNGSFEQARETETVANGVITDPKFINNLGVLIGVAGMGIKAGFYESIEGTDKSPDSLNISGSFYTSQIVKEATGNGSVFKYTDYHKLTGVMKPYLGWGMQLPLRGLTIKPKVGLGFDIYRDSEKYTLEGNKTGIGTPNSTVTLGGAPAPNGDQVTEKKYEDEGYFAPDITVGAGVDFAAQETSQFGVGLDYGIFFKVYNKSYDTANGSDKVAGIVTATNTTTTTFDGTNRRRTEIKSSVIDATEKSEISHTITPSFWYANDLSDRVSLGFGGEVDFSFDFKNSHKKTTTTIVTTNTPFNGYWTKITAVKIEDGENKEVFTFEVEPKLNAGVSWKAIPNRFTLNAGLEVMLFQYTREKTLTKPQEYPFEKFDTVNEAGVVSNPSTDFDTSPGALSTSELEEVKQSGNTLSAEFAIGGNFAFTPNFGVDLYFISDNESSVKVSKKGHAVVQPLNLANPQFSMIFSLKF